jgi:hypothetical protein
MIEIAPGVEIRLRDAEETENAIAHGFYIQCECLYCTTVSSNTLTRDVYCILDCDYVLCPECRTIYPNPLTTSIGGTNMNTPVNGSTATTSCTGGLGLGFHIP